MGAATGWGEPRLPPGVACHWLPLGQPGCLNKPQAAERSKLLCGSVPAARQLLPALAAAGVGDVGARNACHIGCCSFCALLGGRRAAGSACCCCRLLHCCTAPAVVCAAAWAAVASRAPAAASPCFLAPGAAAAAATAAAAAAPAPTAAYWGWHWGWRPSQLRPPLQPAAGSRLLLHTLLCCLFPPLLLLLQTCRPAGTCSRQGGRCLLVSQECIALLAAWPRRR